MGIRKSTRPSLESCRHTAAVKALDWSPHKPGLLATGGGTGDSCIYLWNTTNDVTVRSVDTGSQVCGLLWSKNVNEIISTHGYGSRFEVGLWKCPSMTKITSLPGHSRRVLFLSVSPDGPGLRQVLVTPQCVYGMHFQRPTRRRHPD